MFVIVGLEFGGVFLNRDMVGEIVLDEGCLWSEGFEVGLLNVSWLGGIVLNGVFVIEFGMKLVVWNMY